MQEAQQAEFVRILQEEFNRIKSGNRRFSMRAYAMKLKLHPASLSSILKGKRGLPKWRAIEIAETLKLPRGRKNLFLRSLKSFSQKKIDFVEEAGDSHKVLNSESNWQQKIIEEWEHYAVLSLLEIKKNWDLKKIADALALTHERTGELIERLIFAGLVEKNDSGYVLAQNPGVRTTEDIPSESLMKSHENELALAMKKIRSVPITMRDFSSHTMAIDPSKIAEAKKLIRKFRFEMADLLESGEQKSVYLLMVQLFPLMGES